MQPVSLCQIVPCVVGAVQARQRDRAVVIVTHDSRVLEFADRTIRIEDGLIANPEPRETMHAPEIQAHGFSPKLNVPRIATNPLENWL